MDQRLISKLPKLHHLNLSQNQLETIDDETLKINVELKLLDLSDNYIRNLTELTFSGLRDLEVTIYYHCYF